MGVDSLGYVAFNVTDLPRWQQILERVFGMEPVPRASGDAIDYRLDDFHHRLTLYPADHDGVAAVGWQVADAAALDALVADLRGRGVAVNEGTSAQCTERQVRRLAHYTCPMVGCHTELFVDPVRASAPLRPSRPIDGFKTGDQGLGHIVFWVKDLPATTQFYGDVLGFKVSDHIRWDDNDATFFHCNARHHTLALMAEAEGRPAGRFQHLMIESVSRDDVGYGYDIVRDLGIPVAIEPGKHSNDHMQSFYLKTPSGWWMEYGYGGRAIGEDWEVNVYDAPMLWGHRMVDP